MNSTFVICQKAQKQLTDPMVKTSYTYLHSWFYSQVKLLQYLGFLAVHKSASQSI